MHHVLSMATTQLASLRLRLDLPAETLARYEVEAARRGLTLEDLLTERLANCSSHTSTNPIYLNDTDRSDLCRLLRRNFRGSQDVMQEIRKVCSLRIDSAHISLSPELIRRLRTRALSRPFDQFLSEQVVELLEQYVGMR